MWSEFDHRRWRRHDSAAAGRSGNNAMHMRKGYGIPRDGEQIKIVRETSNTDEFTQ